MTTRVERVRERRGWKGLEVRGYSGRRRCSLGEAGAVTGWWLQGADDQSGTQNPQWVPTSTGNLGLRPALPRLTLTPRKERGQGVQGHGAPRGASGRGSGTEPIPCTSLSGVPQLPVSQHPENCCLSGQGKRRAEGEGGPAPLEPAPAAPL